MNPLTLISEIFSADLISWCLTAVCAVLALDTVRRLWTERYRLSKEVLGDDDRTLAWKIVLFLVLPLLTLADMRATEVVASHLGGYLIKPVYGLVWYHATLGGMNNVSDANSLLAVVFAGAAVQVAFALCLLPALATRPHPFLATTLGYTIVFTLALNLVLDPFLSLAGMGGIGVASRMLVLLDLATKAGLWQPLAIQLGAAALYLTVVLNPSVRQWFSSLTRPHVSIELAECLKEWKEGRAAADSKESDNGELSCTLGLLYVKAGLLFKAKALLKGMQKLYPQSPYTLFLKGIYFFHKRKYKKSRLAFEELAAQNFVEGELKGQLYAAAACGAFAQEEISDALNLCDRALEFADGCLTARMVKVDAYLAQGKKDQAAQEILVAMHLGLEFDLKDKIPVDMDATMNHLKVAVESGRERTAREEPVKSAS